jgi:YfiH family protein
VLNLSGPGEGEGGGGEAGGLERRAVVDDLDLLVVDRWTRAFPGVVAGVTLRPADFGLASGDSAWRVSERYEALARGLGFAAIAVARQVHGNHVRVSDGADQPGFWIVGEADGLATDRAGLLMTVTVADCVPVFLLDPESRCIALLHAGWRGVAAGILDRGIAALAALRGSAASDLHVHLGPAICGSCYEVGPEVLSRFGLQAVEPGPLDLRDHLTGQALSAGVTRAAVTRSTLCTSCDPRTLHSHRGSGGTAGRMAAFFGRGAHSL